MAKQRRSTRPARKSTGATKSDATTIFRQGVAALGAKGALALASLEEAEIDSHIPGWVSTQAIALDRALGGKGLPLGRIVEFFGLPHSAKTTLALHVAAEVQRMGGVAAVLDQEATLDRLYAKAIGVDTTRLQIIQTPKKTIEHGIDALEDAGKVAIAHDLTAVLIWDTVAAAPSKQSLEERAVNAQPGQAAKAIRDACRRFVANFSGSKVLVLMVNQVYRTIARGGHPGPPVVAYGGEALSFYGSVRLSFWPGSKLTDSKDRILGQLSYVTVAKSKISKTTGHKVELAIARGCGVDNVYTLYEEFLGRKLIQYGGSWATLHFEDGESIRWQGGWDGLYRLCAAQPEVHSRLISAYGALNGG